MFTYTTTLIMLVSGVFFYHFPQVDLAAASWFYSPVQGFFLKHNPLILLLYKSVPVMVRFFAVTGLVLLATVYIRKKPIGMFGKRELYFLLLALIIGPGLLVNGVFKEHFGRARPAQIAEFGGSKHFTPAFVIADQCESNCSFVSGHAAVGFYFVAFALLARNYRKLLIALSLLPGVAIGVARMAQGGHFLSDVVFAGLFTILSSYILYLVIFTRELQPER